MLVNQNVQKQLNDELETRLAKIRERLETSRAELAVNIDTVVKESVDTRERSRKQIFATKFVLQLISVIATSIWMSEQVANLCNERPLQVVCGELHRKHDRPGRENGPAAETVGQRIGDADGQLRRHHVFPLRLRGDQLEPAVPGGDRPRQQQSGKQQ